MLKKTNRFSSSSFKRQYCQKRISTSTFKLRADQNACKSFGTKNSYYTWAANRGGAGRACLQHHRTDDLLCRPLARGWEYGHGRHGGPMRGSDVSPEAASSESGDVLRSGRHCTITADDADQRGRFTNVL